MGNFLKVLISLALGLVAMTAAADNMDIHIQNPWVQAAPPNAKVLAAYMEINNHGEKPQIVVSVSSPAFGQVEIHRTVMKGNMANMEHQGELNIPPHGSVELKPGGLHFMLMGAKKPLNVGDQVHMTINLKNGEKVTFIAAVRAGQMEGMGDHQHMKHDH